MMDKFGVEIDAYLKGLLEEEARLMTAMSVFITEGDHHAQESAQRSAQARLQDIRAKINELVLQKNAEKKQPKDG
jgi:hypothetical protein